VILLQDIYCPLLNQYLDYLTVIKGRSENTIIEYRTDVQLFFRYLVEEKHLEMRLINEEFLRSISISDMYSFVNATKKICSTSAGTRARKIVSLRQFWKYLKTKAHVIDNNIAEELETPKRPKRVPKYLTLEEAMRLLMTCQNSPRDHCILTIC
jgi:integrase/recombinase XerD